MSRQTRLRNELRLLVFRLNTISRISRSLPGQILRESLHAIYKIWHKSGRPVRHRLTSTIEIELYPEGEIAEFLVLSWLFEKAEMDLVAAYLKPGMNVIDVGANIGIYSILAQHCIGETGSIWAFEPSTETYQRLRRNIELNKCDKIKPVQAALSDRPGVRLILRSDNGFGDAYRYLTQENPRKKGKDGDEIVHTTTLDLYASHNSVAQVDFLKVDVEGHEYRVLAGARELLASSRNLVMMLESDPVWCERAGVRQEDFFELLRSFGFGLYAWDRRGQRWHSDDSWLLKASTVWCAREFQQLPRS